MNEPGKPNAASGDDFSKLTFWEPSPVLFRYAITALVVGALAFMIVVRIFAPDQTTRYVGPALVALVGATGWVLLALGKTRAAMSVLSIGSWIVITVICIFNGGVRTPVMFAYPAIIFMIGWLVSPNAAKAVGFLTVATIVAFVAAESWGVLPTQPRTPAVMYGVVQVVIVLVSTFLIGFLVNSYKARLAERRGVGSDLARRTIDLQASKAELDHAQAVAKVGSWVYDVGTQTMRLSAESCRIFGLPEGSSGSYDAYLARVHMEDRGVVDQVWHEALKGVAFDHAHRILLAGEVRWVRQKGLLELSAEGRPDRVVGITQDITERKQLDVELEQHRLHLEELVQRRTDELMATEARASMILHSAADGLYGVDTEGIVTFINPAGCRMLGYLPEQVIGRSAHALFHHSRPDGSPYPVADCVGHAAVRSGQELRVDNETYWHADGHAVPVMFAIHPAIQAGRNVGAVVSFIDMSVQRAAAQARERALIAAENLARARSEFLANMSHEIRTPMNGVLGFAHIGYRNYQDTAKARDAFEKILASGKRLLGVVNEVLDFSKIEAGQLQVEAIAMSLTETLDQTLALVADRAGAKGLELRMEVAADLPQRCVSDPLRIGQILLNLLTNAVKFTEAGSIVLSAAREGGELVFRVADTGIGMDSEQLAYVFDPFLQADGSTTRRYGGTGLGLAISKRILELLHGNIAVQSTPGVGSTFEFRLPYVEPAARVAATAPRPAVEATLADKPLAGISILVAEDDPINQLVLEANLLDDGAHLVMVDNGLEAVERVRRDGPHAYHIVLMDIQMPVMGGYDATRRILELAPGLPIIGQTANAFAEDRDRCLAAGMAGYIAKPIAPQDLVKLVLQLVAERHKR